MTSILYLLPASLVGYLLGAIPFGYLYVKWLKKIDIRQIGSGRTGGTNSFRAAGIKAGILTAVSDALKGAASVLLATVMLRSVLNQTWLPWAQAVAGIFSVVGHNWSVYLKFGGGAGTGPNVGWAMALYWPMAPISIIIVYGALRLIGIAAIASMLMALIIPVVFAIRFFTGADATLAYTMGGVVTLAIVLWALRPNIKRLLTGTERLVGPRADR